MNAFPALLAQLAAAPPAVQTDRSKGGWNGTWNPRTTRQYAVRVNGKLVRTASGAVRTFASRAAAQAAGEAVLAAQAAQGGAA